ncbi:MAG: radical SAM family heme chaperone HemW [Planctomycetaceae bacterium]
MHVPFCAHRCGYCDFTLVSGRDDLVDDYLNALDTELATLETPRPMKSLFLGGGTPSHLAIPDLLTLFELLAEWLPVDDDDNELSVEANPLDLVSEEKLQLFAECGVNRISIGVQSFDDAILKTLERDHTGQQAVDVIKTAKVFIDSIAVDLIFGVPGQSLDVWEQTLDLAIEANPMHISTYGLTFEKGTSFWTRREKGTLLPLVPELEREMYALAMEKLPAAGFVQYEISNFAKPGHACRHNIGYWTGQPFFGFGPGAAQYLDGCRELNHRSVTNWLKRIEAGESPMVESERLDPEDRARERAVLNLRQVAGVDKAGFQEQTGFDIRTLGGEAIDRFLARGWLEETATHLRLTREGRFVADTVVAEFL